MSPFIDLTGKRYGRLICLYRYYNKNPANKTQALRTQWVCACDCGNEAIVIGDYLRSGKTASCGCLQCETMQRNMSKRMLNHGLSSSSVYKIWQGMHQRCSNSKDKNYPIYGGRGIKVCKRWGKFEAFYEDMGDRPEGKSIDRKNNNGHYSKRNCRWATPYEQISNRSVSLPAKVVRIIEAIQKYDNITYAVAYKRLIRGLKCLTKSK